MGFCEVSNACANTQHSFRNFSDVENVITSSEKYQVDFYCETTRECAHEADTKKKSFNSRKLESRKKNPQFYNT